MDKFYRLDNEVATTRSTLRAIGDDCELSNEQREEVNNIRPGESYNAHDGIKIIRVE